MTFERDLRTITIAFCVFWVLCAGVGLFAQFPATDAFVGRFDAIRLHVLDYLALAFIPTVLLKEAVWALTRQQERSDVGRHEVIDEVPFFVSPSVKRHPTVTQPDADLGQYEVVASPDARPHPPCRCRAHQHRIFTQADHVVALRDYIPERRAYRIALKA